MCLRIDFNFKILLKFIGPFVSDEDSDDCGYAGYQSIPSGPDNEEETPNGEVDETEEQDQEAGNEEIEENETKPQDGAVVQTDDEKPFDELHKKDIELNDGNFFVEKSKESTYIFYYFELLRLANRSEGIKKFEDTYLTLLCYFVKSRGSQLSAFQ